MKKHYFLLSLFLCLLTTQSHAQENVIYQADPTPGLLSGAVFSGGDFGFSAYAGDGILLAGTDRILTAVEVSIFQRNMVEFITPVTLTVRLYTECPAIGDGGAEGMCEANSASTLIEGSEQSIILRTEPPAGGFVRIPMPNIDVSSETDDTIWVMFNSTSFDILGVVNANPAAPGGVGGQPSGEPLNGVLSRCNTANNMSGCDVTGGALSGFNNFAMIVRATSVLSSDEQSLEKGVTIFPNPISNEATIAFQDFINPRQAKIFDVNGRQVAQKYTYNLENNFKIDMSNLSSGLYFLHFESEEGTVIKQLIKR